MRKELTRLHVFLVLVCLSLLLAQMVTTLPAHADGGAPDLAYVSGTAAGISVIDVGQAKVTKMLAVPGEPRSILLSLDGSLLYVTQPASEQVSILAAKNGKTMCSAHVPGEPTLLALDQNSNILYAAGNGGSQVSAIDASTCAVRHTFSTNSAVYGLAIGILYGGENVLWVTGTDSVSVFGTQSAKLLGTIAIPGGPRYISIPQGSEVAYISTEGGSVDLVDFKLRRVLPLISGGTFGPMDYDALTGEVYVPDAAHNVVDVLSPVYSGATKLPKEPARVISTSVSPRAVAITSDGLLGFVALQNGTVIMLDLLGHHVVYSVTVGGQPHFIITGLYPPSAVVTPTTTPTSSTPQPGQGLSWITMGIIALYTLAFLLILVLGVLLWRLFRTGHVKK